jgi:hypothetical protein
MTTGDSIPDDVRRFVLTSIPSVPYLEAMLLLRAHSAQAWDSAGLAQRLYLSDKAAAVLLAELQDAGVLCTDENRPSSFRYRPATDELRDVIDRLAATYAAQLVAVTHMIHSKTGKKAQHFADAFKWRKDS